MLLSKKKKRKVKARPRPKKAARKKPAKKPTRKRAARKSVKRASTKKAARKAPGPKVVSGEEVQTGKVSHYFPHVKAGAVIIDSGTLAVGDTIHIKGHTTDFKQRVKSLQIDRVPIQQASKGDEIGILVKARVRINDKVYKVKA